MFSIDPCRCRSGSCSVLGSLVNSAVARHDMGSVLPRLSESTWLSPGSLRVNIFSPRARAPIPNSFGENRRPCGELRRVVNTYCEDPRLCVGDAIGVQCRFCFADLGYVYRFFGCVNYSLDSLLSDIRVGVFIFMLQCWPWLSFVGGGLCVESNSADFVIPATEYLHSSATVSVGWLYQELFLIVEQSRPTPAQSRSPDSSGFQFKLCERWLFRG